MTTPNSHRDLQYQHEIAVCENLIRVLHMTLVYARHGNDRDEPDIIMLGLENRTIGIEVATAYYDDIAARAAWDHARGIRSGVCCSWEDRNGDSIVEPDEGILNRIQAEINGKCESRYTGVNETWLCIAAHTPFSTTDSIAEYTDRLYVPDKHCFARIYVLDWLGGNDYFASRLQ